MVWSVCILQFACIKLNDYSCPMSLKLCYSQMDRGWMYLETMAAVFMKGIDSFVKATKAYAGSNVLSSKGYIHCPCVDCKNEKAFRIHDVEQIRYHLLSRGFMKNYKVWNMHGEEGDNLPKETIQGPLPKTAANEIVQQTIHETVGETM